MVMRPRSPAAFLILSIAGLVGYGIVARAVSRRRTAADDTQLRDQIQHARQPEGEAVAEVVSRTGKEWLHIPVSALVSGMLLRRGAGTRAMVPLLASVSSELASRAFDRLPPNRKPPPGHPNPHKPSFPSGHANETTAVSFATAYVLAREGAVTAAPAFAVATILSIASPGTRLYLDRHWTSDVLGGWCLGGAIAAASAAIYESLPQEHALAGGQRAAFGERFHVRDRALEDCCA
jgi:membrane-associated phospholipid phosphatase